MLIIIFHIGYAAMHLNKSINKSYLIWIVLSSDWSASSAVGAEDAAASPRKNFWEKFG